MNVCKHIIILTVFLCGCAKGHEQKMSVEPEFQEYVDTFLNEAATRSISTEPSNLRVVFGNASLACPHTPYPSACCEKKDGQHTIYVNKKVWVMFDQISREMLIMHELGHCVLYREHEGYGDSLMYRDTTAVRESYIQNRSQYLDELFYEL